MPGPHIRLALPTDAEGITEVYMESAEHHAQIDPERCHFPDRNFIETRYRRGKQHPDPTAPAITLVAELNDKIIGFLDAQLQKPFDPMLRPFTYCFIADVAVAATHRSQGVGQQLLEAVELWAKEQKADYLSLIYNSGNPRAGELYARLGYQPGAISLTKVLHPSGQQKFAISADD